MGEGVGNGRLRTKRNLPSTNCPGLRQTQSSSHVNDFCVRPEKYKFDRSSENRHYLIISFLKIYLKSEEN